MERFTAPAAKRHEHTGIDTGTGTGTGTGADTGTGTDTGTGADAGADFEVECRTSGITLTVDASTSILEAAENAGLPVDSSCRDGVCGTCETRVLAGIPDHRDFLLSEAERASGRTMMLCVSRCASDRLVLDL